MKKVFLFFVTVAMSAVACAQDLSLANLMKSPALECASLFTSSRHEIVNEWGCKDTGGPIMFMGQSLSGLSYQKVGISSISFSIDQNTGNRTVVVFFKGNGGKKGAKQLAEQIRTDLQNLGVSMPKVSGGLSFKNNGLPSPFMSISINVSDAVMFSYSVTGDGEPNF